MSPSDQPAPAHPFGPLVEHRARELVQGYLDGFDFGEPEQRLATAIAAILDGSLGELARISEVAATSSSASA